MKNFAIIIVSIFLGFSAQADIWSDYENRALELTARLEAGNETPQTVQTDIDALVSWGYQMMDLYSKKFPECAEQYVQIKKEELLMRNGKYSTLEQRYHDGIGLTPAPKHCYGARSMVVHPHMAVAMLREDLSGAAHEIEEVAARAPVLKRKL